MSSEGRMDAHADGRPEPAFEELESSSVHVRCPGAREADIPASARKLGGDVDGAAAPDFSNAVGSAVEVGAQACGDAAEVAVDGALESQAGVDAEAAGNAEGAAFDDAGVGIAVAASGAEAIDGTSNGFAGADDAVCAAAHAAAATGEEELRALRRHCSDLSTSIDAERELSRLTLQTLAATLRLGPDITWADVVERVEVLFAEGTKAEDARLELLIKNVNDGIKETACDENYEDAVRRTNMELSLAREEAWQADLECERLEERMEAQAAHSARIREILQKQQRLLDMTAQQIDSHERKGVEQRQVLTDVESREASLLKKAASDEGRLAALTEECNSLSQELEMRSKLTAKQEQDIRTHKDNIASLEASLQDVRQALAASEEECQRLREEGQRHLVAADELRLLNERQRDENLRLMEELSQEQEMVEELREQLQVYEFAERRRFGYGLESCASLPPLENGPLEVGDDVDAHSDRSASAQALVPSSVSSARTGYSGGGAKPSGGRSAPLRFSRQQQPTAGSRPLSSRSSAASSGSAAPEAGTATGRLRRTPMMADKAERDAFLSHFPMASRTEKAIRERLEERKRAERKHLPPTVPQPNVAPSSLPS